MINIILKDDNYFIKKISTNLPFYQDIETNRKCAYLMFKGTTFPDKHRKYQVQQGDVIKLGRTKLEIQRIYLDGEHKAQIHSLEEENNVEYKKQHTMSSQGLGLRLSHPIKTRKQYKEAKGVINSNTMLTLRAIHLCRICQENANDIKNPLIRPCLCSGSMKYIHYECLKQWIKTKICIPTYLSQYCVKYVLNDEVICELCKAPLPDFVKLNNKLYELLDFGHESNNYMLLRNLYVDKKNCKYLYLIKFDEKNEISVGRKPEADFFLSEQAVSRSHMIFSKVGKRIFFQDCDSKFGTGVLLQNPILNILENDPLYLQINQTLFTFSIVRPFSFFSCCSEPIEFCNMSYQKLNSKFLTDHSKEIIIKDEDNDRTDTIHDENNLILSIERRLPFLNDELSANDKDDTRNLIISHRQSVNVNSSKIFSPVYCQGNKANSPDKIDNHLTSILSPIHATKKNKLVIQSPKYIDIRKRMKERSEDKDNEDKENEDQDNGNEENKEEEEECNKKKKNQEENANSLGIDRQSLISRNHHNY